MHSQHPKAAQIEALRRRIAQLEGTPPGNHHPAVSSGCGPLDRVLPGRGFRGGTLVEWLASGEGSGAVTLALGAARAAACHGGALVVLDGSREFYPPAAARLGIELDRLIVVHAPGAADQAWALDQALRCPGVAAALAWVERLEGRAFRRLQLAAEQGGGLGLLIRPEAARHEPSWADVRLRIEPLPGQPRQSSRRRLRIQMLRCRGAVGGRSVEVEIDEEADTVHLAPRMAVAADPRRAAGA